MNTDHNRISAIPTNVITGFLGVGKTSAILHLLKHKPASENWAVLINEFGEIGVDGSLVQGQNSEQQGVYIREVPGGCMCCTAGLPMQVALNELLKRAKPDRLLIEPTGLGHPKEVLEALSADHYQDVLKLQKTLTLVDARKLSDARYTSHDTFNQQIAIADIVVGNKTDLYQDSDKANLAAYINKQGQAQAEIVFTQHGELRVSLLEGYIGSHKCNHDDHHHDHEHSHAHDHASNVLASDISMPDSGVISAVNEGEGFNSVGWRFAANKVFDHQKLRHYLSTLDVERMKAAFITEDGDFGFNLADGTLTETELDSCNESRIEIISADIIDTSQAHLLDCLISH